MQAIFTISLGREPGSGSLVFGGVDSRCVAPLPSPATLRHPFVWTPFAEPQWFSISLTRLSLIQRTSAASSPVTTPVSLPTTGALVLFDTGSSFSYVGQAQWTVLRSAFRAVESKGTKDAFEVSCAQLDADLLPSIELEFAPTASQGAARSRIVLPPTAFVIRRRAETAAATERCYLGVYPLSPNLSRWYLGATALRHLVVTWDTEAQQLGMAPSAACCE